MKIQILDQNTKKPYANGKLQLQVRGKDSGYLTAATDASGYCMLDDKYSGQQIALATGGQGQWVEAVEGAKLYYTGTTTGAGAGAGSKDKTTTK